MLVSWYFDIFYCLEGQQKLFFPNFTHFLITRSIQFYYWYYRLDCINTALAIILTMWKSGRRNRQVGSSGFLFMTMIFG